MPLSSEYTEEMGATICERLSNGEPMRRICSDADMPNYTTTWRWMNAFPEFREKVLYSRKIGTHNLADKALEVIEAEFTSAEQEDLKAAISLRKLKFDGYLRLAGKWNQHEYGDKQSVEHSGKDGAPIQTEGKLDVSGLTTDQLRALSSIAVK